MWLFVISLVYTFLYWHLGKIIVIIIMIYLTDRLTWLFPVKIHVLRYNITIDIKD